MATAVQRFQFFSAVSQLADLSLLYQAVAADPNNEIWIEFNAANCVEYGDPLAQLTQSVYGWSEDQMVQLFKIAQLTPTACTGSFL
jgi:hypothetical protein